MKIGKKFSLDTSREGNYSFEYVVSVFSFCFIAKFRGDPGGECWYVCRRARVGEGDKFKQEQVTT